MENQSEPKMWRALNKSHEYSVMLEELERATGSAHESLVTNLNDDNTGGPSKEAMKNAIKMFGRNGTAFKKSLKVLRDDLFRIHEEVNTELWNREYLEYPHDDGPAESDMDPDDEIEEKESVSDDSNESMILSTEGTVEDSARIEEEGSDDASMDGLDEVSEDHIEEMTNGKELKVSDYFKSSLWNFRAKHDIK
ncbi:MAG: hypothetical protein Q9220_005751 [cf. Caloplaca sp. 1 TL-2023]